MTADQHIIIRKSFLAGYRVEDIAAAAGCQVPEAEIYLTAWCSEGCPGEDWS